ncbi:MAG: thiamine-phosphate pyrophosphorylase [Elusimicrobiota bacterium]
MNDIDEKKIYRIIDVNYNRAKEGLRTVEEYFRFYDENCDLMKDIRRLRHELDLCVKDHYFKMLESRNIKEDEGRLLPEDDRPGLNDLLISNCKRVQEALRVIEEYSKVLQKDVSKKFKDIRFRMYELEQRIIMEGE